MGGRSIGTRQAWECKIGVQAGVDVPTGGDFPMRRAVEAAFVALTGAEPEFIFSGWGARLTEPQRAVVENRMIDEGYILRERVRDAAPDLYAFIEWVAGQSSGQHADPLSTLKHMEDMARAALAKADGKTVAS